MHLFYHYYYFEQVKSHFTMILSHQPQAVGEMLAPPEHFTIPSPGLILLPSESRPDGFPECLSADLG